MKINTERAEFLIKAMGYKSPIEMVVDMYSEHGECKKCPLEPYCENDSVYRMSHECFNRLEKYVKEN